MTKTKPQTGLQFTEAAAYVVLGVKLAAQNRINRTTVTRQVRDENGDEWAANVHAQDPELGLMVSLTHRKVPMMVLSAKETIGQCERRIVQVASQARNLLAQIDATLRSAAARDSTPETRCEADLLHSAFVAKNPLKKWEAAMVTWERHAREKGLTKEADQLSRLLVEKAEHELRMQEAKDTVEMNPSKTYFFPMSAKVLAGVEAQLYDAVTVKDEEGREVSVFKAVA